MLGSWPWLTRFTLTARKRPPRRTVRCPCRCPLGTPCACCLLLAMRHAPCAMLQCSCSLSVAPAAPSTLIEPGCLPPLRPPSRLPAPHPTTCTLHLHLHSHLPALAPAPRAIHPSTNPRFHHPLILSTLTSSHRLATRRGPSRRSFLIPPPLNPSLRSIVTACTASSSSGSDLAFPRCRRSFPQLLLHLVLLVWRVSTLVRPDFCPPSLFFLSAP